MSKDGSKVKVTAAKGRPMLTWVGKRPLSAVTAFPAQHIETFDPLGDDARPDDDLWADWPDKYPRGGLLFHGDNEEVLAHLLANGFRGKVQLIYIDPPFDSGADYVRHVRLRGATGSTQIEGEGYTLGEQMQYEDIWANDNYLQFMYERLLLLRELLGEEGSLALHCDAKRSHLLRVLLEEVFGEQNFRAEIIVRAGVKNVQSQFETMSSLTLGSNTIFLFSKSTEMRYPKLQSVSEEFEPGKWDTFWRGTDRHTMRYELFGQTPDHGQWRWSQDRALRAANNHDLYQREYAEDTTLDDYYLAALDAGEDLDFLRLSPHEVVQYYVPPRKYRVLDNVWLDLPYRGTETDYPTEKHEAIAQRLINWTTRPGHIVVDTFVGSGTVAAAAQKLGRRWIGCDINRGATQASGKRLQTVISQQAADEARPGSQGVLSGLTDSSHPAQFSFSRLARE